MILFGKTGCMALSQAM